MSAWDALDDFVPLLQAARPAPPRALPSAPAAGLKRARADPPADEHEPLVSIDRGTVRGRLAKAQAAKVGRGVRARFDRLGGDDGSCG